MGYFPENRTQTSLEEGQIWMKKKISDFIRFNNIILTDMHEGFVLDIK